MEPKEQLEQLEDLSGRLAGERPAPWDGLPDIPLYMDQLAAQVGHHLIHIQWDIGQTFPAVRPLLGQAALEFSQLRGGRWRPVRSAGTLPAFCKFGQFLHRRTFLLKSYIQNYII